MLSFLFLAHGAELKVAALHPILGDLARQIGGGHVQVVDLLKPNGNLHAFEPTSRQIAEASGSRLLLASGKNLEPYLASLDDSLKNGNPPCLLVDVGAGIPDVPASGDCGEEHDEDHDHGDECGCCDHGPNDPHWWHTPANMKRAGRVLCSGFSKADPEHAADYRRNLQEWNRKMDALDAWARVRLSKVPEKKRILAIGHAAMNHFCRQYGFTEVHVQGVSREDESNPARLAKILNKMRAMNLPVIFPEYSASPKSLEEVAKSLGIPMGRPLVTDGLSPEAQGFEAMFRWNVDAIADGLEGGKEGEGADA